jgi:hypothetical protein
MYDGMPLDVKIGTAVFYDADSQKQMENTRAEKQTHQGRDQA